MNKKFETWAIVELFGHTTIAGFVSEQEVGGASMIRVDVPKVNGREPFTKFFGSGAIYGITPTTEENAKAVAASIDYRPVSLYLLPGQAEALPYGDPGEKWDDDDFDDMP